MRKKYFIGFDIGGTKVSAGLVNAQERIISQKKYATPPKANPEDIMESVGAMVNELLNEEGLSLTDIGGIGFGVPGIVDRKGTIVRTPNLNLDGFELKQEAKNKFGVKVEVGNDVNVGLLGEKWFGAAQGYNNIIGIFPGTGVGGAIIINGKFITGVNGGAAEVGHMIVHPRGPKCSCGNMGCLEAYAGRWAIERDIRAAMKKGTKTEITSILKKPDDPIKSNILDKAWKKEDTLAKSVLDNVCLMLGKACVSLRHIIDPDIIVLGGGVIEACGEWMLPKIQHILDEDPFFKSFASCPVTESQLGDEAIILGAVALVSRGLKSSLRQAVQYYPWISINSQNKIVVNGKTKKPGFLVHANGIIKKHKRKKKLNLHAIIKKEPEILFIGSDQGSILSTIDEKCLSEHGIQFCVHPVKEAIEQFNISRLRKSLLVI